MFRDPTFFRALRERVVPLPAHVSVAQDLGRRVQHRRGGVLVRDPLARRGPARAHADLRDRHQPARRCARPRPASTTLERIARFTENHRLAGGDGSLSELLHGGLRPARCSTALREHDRVLRPQPRDRQRVRRGAARVVPQRAHLLRPRAAGPRARPVPDVAVPHGLPRPRRAKRRCSSPRTRRAFSELRRRGAHGTSDAEERRSRHDGTSRPSSSEDRRARRGARVLLPALPGGDAGRRSSIVVHLRANRPSLVVDLFCAEVRARRSARPRTRSRSRPVRIYFAPPDYHLLVERGATFALSVDAPVQLLAARRSTCCSSRAADAFGSRAARRAC